MNKKELKKTEIQNDDSISRRTALQKMGYAAFASSTMFLLLNNPTKVYAVSIADPGEDPFPEGNKTLREEQPAQKDAWTHDDDPWK